jgi:hypothetical protein
VGSYLSLAGKQLPFNIVGTNPALDICATVGGLMGVAAAVLLAQTGPDAFCGGLDYTPDFRAWG